MEKEIVRKMKLPNLTKKVIWANINMAAAPTVVMAADKTDTPTSDNMSRVLDRRSEWRDLETSGKN